MIFNVNNMANETEPDETAGDKGRDIVTALTRGLDVLRCCTENPDGISLATVARLTGLSRATVRRSLLTLREAGYVLEADRLFVPTPRVLTLAGALLSTPSLQVAQPVLDRLSRTLDESVSLASLDGTSIIYRARSERRRIMTLDLSVGSHLPAYCTSMGRVLLAALPPSLLEAHLDPQPAAHTARTVVARDALLTLLAQVREDGFCIVDGELELGLRSLAVPVRLDGGAVPMALNVSTQVARTSLEDMHHLMLPALLQAAEDLAPAFAQRTGLEPGWKTPLE